jgi:hypothetical protein
MGIDAKNMSFYVQKDPSYIKIWDQKFKKLYSMIMG